MPNWAYTHMRVVGKREDVTVFQSYLENINMYSDKSDKKFFYRSFPQSDISAESLTELHGGICEFDVFLECAWSAWGCLEQRPSEGHRKGEFLECLVLSEVSRDLNLVVELYSEETGIGFQEHCLVAFGDIVIQESTDYSENYDEDEDACKSHGGYEWDFSSVEMLFNLDGTPNKNIHYTTRTELMFDSEDISKFYDSLHK